MILKYCNNNQSVVGTREDGATVSYSIEAEEVKQWLSEGNTPEPEFTQVELDAQALFDFKAQVQTAIDDTDRTMIRVSQGVVLGTCAFTNPDVVTFVQYIHNLRTLLGSTTVQIIPTKPPYPVGS